MHPELAGKVVAFKDFTDEGRGDLCGHGSHCAGTIAAQNTGGHGILGIAPGVELIDAKIFDESGTGDTMAIAAAVRWAADNGAKVISMSLGGGHQTDGSSLLTRVCENVASEQDIVIVIAAGNDGQAGSISVPGDTASALTVGAIDKNTQLAEFSSRGPTLDESVTGIKPNLVAPGVEIVSVSSGQVKNGVDYEAADGTSMACPHVAGAAAALWAYAPKLSANQVRELLENSCTPVEGSHHEVGHGLVNVPNALASSRRIALAAWPKLPKLGKGNQKAVFVLAAVALAWFLWPSSNQDSEETDPLGAPPIAKLVPKPSPPPVSPSDPTANTETILPIPNDTPVASFRSDRLAELSRPDSKPDLCSTQPRCFCVWKKEGIIERQVQSGETLNQWSELFAVPRNDLAAWNGIGNTANIAQGDKLLVSMESLSFQTHRIRRGDVAGVIANRNGLPTSLLAKQNCLKDLNKIFNGQHLLIVKEKQVSQ
jgi:LysM repeat protein